MGKRIPKPCLDVIMIAFIPDKYTVKDHISNTKLEKGEHYYIRTREKDLLSHYNLILRKLKKKKNVPKSSQKYKRNVLKSPGHPIILLKSN